VIKRITERVSPRVFRVVALPAPTEREKSQMYIQRYLSHFPAAGEVVIFDRSWYNRAGVERVMGFTSEDEVFRFLRLAPPVEQAMVDSGIILLKYWLEVGQEQQTRRIESRIDDPRKVWKLSPMDLKSYSRWYEYSRARDEMFAATNTAFAPWHVADANDKKRARLNIISHLLEQVPYDSPKRGPPAALIDLTGSEVYGATMQDEPRAEEEFAAIRARANAATPDPWESFVEGRDHHGGDDLIRIGGLDNDWPDMSCLTTLTPRRRRILTSVRAPAKTFRAPSLRSSVSARAGGNPGVLSQAAAALG